MYDPDPLMMLLSNLETKGEKPVIDFDYLGAGVIRAAQGIHCTIYYIHNGERLSKDQALPAHDVESFWIFTTPKRMRIMVRVRTVRERYNVELFLGDISIVTDGGEIGRPSDKYPANFDRYQAERRARNPSRKK